ncbi:hypothetical protein C8R43DRAFT_949942 [Mycena crocata]|nr:hypothetical protein C8R43DRAFT_949942 [Mycena crocata]
MAYTLFDRWNLNKKIPLGTSVYNDDFAPTRDRSHSTASFRRCIFTFKDCASEEAATAETRGSLQPFLTEVYGRIDEVLTLRSNTGLLVRLSCPPGVSCGSENIFQQQVQVLQTILKEDAEIMVMFTTPEPRHKCGSTKGSWFSPSIARAVPPTEVPAFWVSVLAPTRHSFGRMKARLAPGACVLVLANMLRYDYASSVGIVHEREASCILAEPGYLVKYAPTPDVSKAGGRVLSFKGMTESFEHLGDGHSRGFLLKYKVGAMGEVDAVFFLPENAGLMIRLCCPRGASCSTVKFFNAQMDTLVGILDTDATSMVNVKSYSAEEMQRFKELVNVGALLRLEVSFQRHDTVVEDSGKIKRLRSGVCSFSMTTTFDDYTLGNIADAVLYRDFAPARDRSHPEGGDILIYYDCHHEFEGTLDERGQLEIFYPSVFGVIDWVGCMVEGEGLVVRLACPPDIPCSVKALYARQMSTVEGVVALERTNSRAAGGLSWLGDADRPVPRLHVVPGCFYVELPVTPDDSMQDLLTVATVGSMCALWAFVCNVIEGGCASGRVYLAKKIARSFFYLPCPPEKCPDPPLSWFSTLFVSFHDHWPQILRTCVPFSGYSSTFTMWYLHAELGRKPSAEYFNSVLEIGPPNNPSCDVEDLYSAQLRVMQDIVKDGCSDLFQQGGSVGSSWFDLSHLNPELVEKPGVFYVVVRMRTKEAKQRIWSDLWTTTAMGKAIHVSVALECRVTYSVERPSRAYDMFAARYGLLRATFPVKREALEDVYNTDWDYNFDAARRHFQPVHSGQMLNVVLPMSVEIIIRRLAIGLVPFEKNGEWRNLFDTMDSSTLFSLICRSRDLAPIVSDYINHCMSPGGSASWLRPVPALSLTAPLSTTSTFPGVYHNFAVPPSVLDSIPNEVYSEIFTHLNLLDRIRLGRTSARGRAFASARPPMEFLMTVPPAELEYSNFTRLYLYTPREKFSWVLAFLQMTTPFTRLGTIKYGSPYGVSCVDGGQTLLDNADRELVVVRSCTSNSVQPLLIQPYSSWFGGLTQHGLWHGHPAATCRMKSLPNQHYVYLSHPAQRLTSMVTVRKLLRSGFRLSRHFNVAHVCPGDFRCPRTSRASFDDGCLALPFPDARFGGIPASSVLCDDQHVFWSLSGGGPCPKGSESCAAKAACIAGEYSDSAGLVWRMRWDSLYQTALRLSRLPEAD